MDIVNDTPFEVGCLFTTSASSGGSLTVIVKGSFDLGNDQAVTVATRQRPLCGDFVWEERSDEVLKYESDFAPFKPRADLLLVEPPLKADGSSAIAAFQVGARKASLHHYGPRSRAEGPRAELAAPLGSDWFLTHWPRLRGDCPYDYFNAASPELQLEGYLKGNEAVAVASRNARFGDLHAQLPGLRGRAFLKDHEGSVTEVTMNLDTLWMDPAESQLVLIWRGRTAAEAGQLEDEGLLLIASEPLEEPKPAAVYEARLAADVPQEAPEDEPSPESEMDTAMAETELEPAELPEELRTFFKDPDGGAAGLAALMGVGAGGSASGAEVGGAESIAAEMSASGVSVSDAPAALVNPLAASADADFAEQIGLGGTQVAGMDAEQEQGMADMPAEIKSALEDPESARSDLIALLKGSDSPAAQELAAEAEKQPVPAMPSKDELDQATAAVPDWPPQNADDLQSMETLTALFGAGRPPEGDGAGFLIVLNGFADQASAAAASPDAIDPYEEQVT